MDFAALERGYKPYDIGKTAPSKKKEKDFFTDQISTVGGVLGGIAGAPLGLFGVGGGAAAGSALGETLENALTGNNLTDNVLQEGVLGGVFGAGPIRLGKALLGAGKAATNTGKTARTVAGNVDSAVPAATAEPLKTSVQGKMQDLGNKAILSQYGTITGPLARSTAPSKTVAELADYGLVDPVDVERIGRAITGSGGILNKAVAKSVAGAGGVDTSNLRRIAEDALQLNGVVEKDAKSVLSIVDAQLRRLQGGPAGSLNPLANPNDALDVMKTLERRIADLTGKGGNARLATGERADQAKALQMLRDEIEERLYRGAGADKNVGSILTPEIRDQLLALKPNDAKWRSYVDNNVMNAQSVSDLRRAQAPFVKAGQIIENADQNALTMGGRSGNLANALTSGGLTNAATTLATNLAQPVLARFGGQALRNGSTRIASNSGTSQTARQPSKLGIAARVGVGAPLASTAVDYLQNDVAQPEPSDLASALAPNAPQQINEIPAQMSPYPRENLIADIERDPENASEYIKQFQAFQEIYSTAEDEPSASLAKALTQSANGEATINQLSSLLEGAGGGMGNIGGNVSSFLGGLGLNDSAKTYNDLARGSVAQLAKAMGETGALSDSDIATYSAMLPKLTDTDAVAQNKIKALRERLLAAQQNTLRFGAAPTDLTDALLASGQ